MIFLTLLFLILGDPILKNGLDSFQMCGKRAQISRIIVLRNLKLISQIKNDLKWCRGQFNIILCYLKKAND